MNTSRMDALRAVAAEFASDLVVFTCGSTSLETAACDLRPNRHHPVPIAAVRIATARKRKRPGQSRPSPGCIPRPCAI